MRTITEVAEDIKSILNNIERTEECNGETLVDINAFVDEILSINARGRAMDPIAINKDEVLILKTDLLLHPATIEKVRNDVIQQIEGGALIIPNNFTYVICKRDFFERPEVITKKRMIDVDVWIDKMAKIVSDPEAPGEYKDNCMHLINEIEAEFRAQEGEA